MKYLLSHRKYISEIGNRGISLQYTKARQNLTLMLCLNVMYTFLFNTINFFLQEVGSIIGKKGEIVKRFREEVSFVRSIFFFNV